MEDNLKKMTVYDICDHLEGKGFKDGVLEAFQGTAKLVPKSSS